MVWGIIVSCERHGATDSLVAGAITGGVAELLMTGPISSSEDSCRRYGLTGFGCFLALDQSTSTFQEKLFKEHVAPEYNQTFYIISGSCIISSSVLVPPGRITHAIGFATSHPAFAWDSMTLSAAAVGGQWFIYSQVKEFGALVFAATMNVRQVVSILISYAKYGHSITPLQVLGLLLVFAGLFYKSISGLLDSPKDASKGEKKPLLENKGSSSAEQPSDKV